MLIQLLSFILVQIVLGILCGIFGMTLLPDFLRRTENKNALFLVTPLLGGCVWLALTVGLGLLFPYDIRFLGGALLLAAVWVFYRREKLFLPGRAAVWILLAWIIFFAATIGCDIAPRKIDGGFYFTPCIYDHIKCAIVHGIASHGLPPVNPWLADGGKPLALAYYFGWHAWAAQLPMLTGCDAFFAECAMTGFTFALVMAGIAGLTGFCDDKKGRFGILFLAMLAGFDIEYTEFAAVVLPKSWMAVLSTPELSGFWNLYDNFLWSPQHMIAAAAVILILCFHGVLLRSDSAKTSAECAVLIGLLAATAVFTSVYSGVFSLLVVGLIIGFDYVCKRKFRSDFNRAIWYQTAAVVLCLALTAGYVKFLFTYPPENPPLAFGLMPCFGNLSAWWEYPLCFLQFYFIVLPMRFGIAYVFGMIAIFVPGILPEQPVTSFCKKYIIASFLAIFFIHSTFYSNDFGWRLLSAPVLLLAAFSVFALHKVYQLLVRCVKKRWIAIAVSAPLVVVFLIISAWDYFTYRDVLRYDAALHRDFARAVPGWEVVRSHTDKDDLVLCNPAGFYEIGKLYAGQESTNVFFSLYAQRDTPIADLIFSKCYSEFFPQEKVEARYNKVVAIFAGNPTERDAEYLAGELKTRAILVTPRDGLWKDPGKIETCFPMKEETENFRVYWREK